MGSQINHCSHRKRKSGAMRAYTALLMLFLVGAVAITAGVSVADGADESIIALLDAEEEHNRIGEADDETASVSSLEGDDMGMDEEAEFRAFTKKHRKQYKDHYLNPSLHDEYLQSETFKTSLLQVFCLLRLCCMWGH